MAELSSREKSLYWILIVIIALGGGAGLAYYFVAGRNTGTSLSTIPSGQQTSTSSEQVNTQSLIDIVEKPAPSPTPAPGTNKTNQVPAPANNATNQVPVPANNTTQNRTNQIVSDQPFNNTTQNRSNQLVVAANTSGTGDGTTVTSGLSTASGSALPTDSPEAGAGALLLSGIASLGVSGVATSLALRRKQKKGRTTR